MAHFEFLLDIRPGVRDNHHSSLVPHEDSSMPKSYRVAVIGRTGRGDYGHGLDTVWLGFDNVEIVGVADENPRGRAQAAERLKAKNAYGDFREMLVKERPQLVSVAPRWLDCHRDMVVACAEAGVHIFLEKPLCRTLAEADEMVTACERHHVKLAIAHQTRYSPRLERVRELLAEGRLGELIEMRGRGKEDARAGGEDLMVLGTHIMDLMRLIAGDARSCYASVLKGGKPVTKADVREGSEGIGPLTGDQISAQYVFDKGVQGYFGTRADRALPVDKTRTVPGSRFGLTLYGTRGIITLTTGSLPAAHFCPDAAWAPGRANTPWQPITSAGLGADEPLKDGSANAGNRWIVQDLFEAIEKDRQPRGSVYDGRAALEMILAAYASHGAQGPVPLPLKERRHPLTLW
jgi:predicted dehydrogenase